LIKQISDDLDELIEIKKILKNFPSIEEIPTIVIAGYPNAGKSTLLKTLTGSNVKTAGYPFTTKSIMIGKKIHKYKEYQIIDSPGLLDRPMNERNRIELQAILAIEELSDVIIFLIDPTAMLDPQLSLLNEIRKFCPSVLVVINKKDLVDGTTIRNLTKKLKQFSPIVVSVTDRKDCETVFLRTVNLCCN
ncbi:MAG TPA: GTP-binding protein, partial [Candidatus Altiarchaeales archaeon]|nr:GTP-binding protein [Candidatus Altiarchaeales archaeon]